MKKYDHYKRIVKFFSTAVIVAIEIALYYILWVFYYNPKIGMPFWRRGNWFLAALYAMALAVLHHLYGGLKIGYLRRNNVIYSQLLALGAANIFGYFLLALLERHWYSPLPFFVLTGIDMLFVTVWAFLFQWIYNRLFPPRKLLLVYGDRPVYHILDKFNSRDDKYVLTGAVHISRGIDEIMKEVPAYGGVIIGDLPSHERNLILKRCYDIDMRVYMIPKISDILIRSSSELNLFDTSLLLSRNDGLQVDQLFCKRVLDVVSALILLVLFSPIFAAAALAVHLEDHGPVFYRQKRLTKDGEVFDILKFRTMRVDAEKDGKARLSVAGDSRITRVGRVLRATRLDELPQILNILHGEMSMVGPRPERPEIAEEYRRQLPEWDYRLKVKAGLTGFAQIYGMYNTTSYDKLKLDLTYIRNYSLLLDLKLIFMTPKIMFMREKTEGVQDGQVTASVFGDDSNTRHLPPNLTAASMPAEKPQAESEDKRDVGSKTLLP